MSPVSIILDTSAVHQDPFLRGARLSLLIGCRKELQLALHLPQIVIDELHNQFVRDLRASAQKAIAAHARLSSYGVSSSPSLTESGAVSIGRRKLSKHLSAFIPDNDIAVTPYPNIPHEKLAKRAMRGTKPFASTSEGRDRGYKDALVWESVKTVLADTNHPAIFVTNNTRDFCLDDKLHPDLVRDLSRTGLEPNRLRIVTDLSALLNEFVLPHLANLTDVTAQINTNHYVFLDILDWIKTSLPARLVGHQIGPTGALSTPAVIDSLRFGDTLRATHAVRTKAREVWVQVLSPFTASIHNQPFNPLIASSSIDGVMQVDLVVDENNKQVLKSDITSTQVHQISSRSKNGGIMSMSYPSSIDVHELGSEILELMRGNSEDEED